MGRKASRTVYILAGLVVLGAVLRFAGIGGKSFWVDEAGAAARMSLPFGVMLEDVKALDTHPPFYYILLFWWQRVFGAGDGALRGLSAVFGLATIPLVYALGKLLFDRKAGLAAAGLFAVSAYHVYFAQENRLYSLTALLAVVTTYFFARLVTGKGRWGSWVGYLISATACVYTFYYLAFLLLAHGAALIGMWSWSGGGERVPVRKLALKWVICMVVVGAFFSPWLPVVFRWAGKVGPGAGEEVSRMGLGGWAVPNALREFTHGYWVPENTLGYAVYFALVLAAVGTAQVWLGKRTRGILLLDMWLLFPLLCVAVLPTKMHIFESKHVLYTSPAVYLLAGFGMTRLRKWGGVLCGVLVLTNAASLNVYYRPEFQKEDWREVAAVIREGARAGDVIYLNPHGIAYAFARYWKGMPGVRLRFAFDWYWMDLVAGRTTLGDEPEGGFDERSLKETVSDAGRVWLVHGSSRVIGPDEGTWRYLTERLPRREEVLRRDYFMGAVRVWLMERGEGEGKRAGEKGEGGDERAQ